MRWMFTATVLLASAHAVFAQAPSPPVAALPAAPAAAAPMSPAEVDASVPQDLANGELAPTEFRMPLTDIFNEKDNPLEVKDVPAVVARFQAMQDQIDQLKSTLTTLDAEVGQVTSLAQSTAAEVEASHGVVGQVMATATANKGKAATLMASADSAQERVQVVVDAMHDLMKMVNEMDQAAKQFGGKNNEAAGLYRAVVDLEEDVNEIIPNPEKFIPKLEAVEKVTKEHNAVVSNIGALHEMISQSLHEKMDSQKKNINQLATDITLGVFPGKPGDSVATAPAPAAAARHWPELGLTEEASRTSPGSPGGGFLSA